MSSIRSLIYRFHVCRSILKQTNHRTPGSDGEPPQKAPKSSPPPERQLDEAPADGEARLPALSYVHAPSQAQLSTAEHVDTDCAILCRCRFLVTRQASVNEFSTVYDNIADRFPGKSGKILQNLVSRSLKAFAALCEQSPAFERWSCHGPS
jgi:hypothetical protein